MHPRFPHYASLAAGLARRPALRVEIGPWAWSPGKNMMRIDPETGDGVTDHDRGAIGHEAAHSHISHYLLFAPLADLRPGLSAFLLNALEDPRVHEWLARVYGPEMRDWLKALRAGYAKPRTPGPSAALGFLAATAVGEVVDYRRPVLWDLPRVVIDALKTTSEARRAYAQDYLPETVAAEIADEDIMALFAREVGPMLEEPMAEVCSDRAISLIASARAWRRAEADVAPVMRALVKHDLARLEGAAARDRSLGRRLRATGRHSTALRTRAVLEALARGETRDVDAVDPALLEALEELIVRATSPHAERVSAGFPDEMSGAPLWHGAPAVPADQPSETELDILAAQAARQVDALVATLRRHLRSDPPSSWRRGFRTGARLDLNALMQAEANPRIDRVWMRRLEAGPVTEANVILLVDLSGSMGGEKIAGAAAAVVAIAEAFRRLERLHWKVLGFQDKLIPIASKGTAFHPVAIRSLMLEEVANRREGGNNAARYNDDGPCLLAAAAQLPAAPNLCRVLMVLSDGRPCGKHSDSGELKEAVRIVTGQGIDLVGLGVGPGTEHVTDFYPKSRADIPLDRLAQAVTGVLESALKSF